MENLPERDTLSRTDLWEKLRTFYQKEGISAWNAKTPFYITSNPYLANAYAQVIMRFIEDLNTLDKADKDTPVYILELGAGPGAFSFYLLKNLVELRNTWFGFEGKFIYIMSDLVPENLEFAKNHPSFKRYIEEGTLKFSLFDAERDEIPIIEGQPMETSAKPLIVLANYVFDSLSADVFQIEGKTLRNLQVKRTVNTAPLEIDNAIVTLDDIDAGAFYRDISIPYFKEPALNNILTHYLEQEKDTVMLFPTGPLSCIERLRKRNPQMLMLIADKGDVEPTYEQLYGFAVHGGSFSSMVDFYALNIYAKQNGGEAFHHPSTSLIVSALSIGQDLSALPETRRALAQSLAMVNPIHLYEIFGYFSETKPFAKLETIVSLLQLTSWDPIVFSQFFDVIIASLPFAQLNSIEQVASNAHRMAANVFFLPGISDFYALLGNFFQEIKRYQEAILYYQQSINTFGEADGVLYNIALCHYQLKNSKDALTFMERTLKANPGYILAKGWIVQIQEEER